MCEVWVCDVLCVCLLLWRRNKKVQGVNLQEKKVWWEEVSRLFFMLAGFRLS